jgi:tRNA modification GTPase
LQEGLKVSIIGKPNVGKSSLMNALLRETRAIVTDIPGTTRDTIRETLSIQGIPVQLTDTAGIRKTENAIERMGIERSKASFMEADLILLMLDVSQELSDEDKFIIEHIGKRRTLILANKIDLGARATMEEIRTFLPDVRIIETSMVQETGLTEVEEEIKALVYGGKVSQRESLVVTSARHGQLLERAADSAAQALVLAKRGEPLEIVELELHAAYDALGEILGETVSDDVLDQVFARFCLGK